MAFTAIGENLMLDDLAALAGYLGLHNVAGPTDGTTEATGGSPAYARKAITWAASSGGIAAVTGLPITFDVPPMTVRAVAVWSAPTGGSLYGYWTLADEIYPIQGTLTISSGQMRIA